MNNKLIFYDKAGDIVLGEIIENSPTEIKIKMLYPYYGICLNAKPKMCMLFSNKTYKTMGIKVLEKCFYLGKIISRRSKEIKEDFIELEEKLKKIKTDENSNKTEETLKNDFRILYLNGFQSVPELIINPLEDLYAYLKEHFDAHPQAQTIQLETKFSNHSEAITQKLQKIKDNDIKSY